MPTYTRKRIYFRHQLKLKPGCHSLRHLYQLSLWTNLGAKKTQISGNHKAVKYKKLFRGKDPTSFFSVGIAEEPSVMLATLQGCFYETQKQLRAEALPATNNNFYWIQNQDLWATNPLLEPTRHFKNVFTKSHQISSWKFPRTPSQKTLTGVVEVEAHHY